MHKRRPSSEGRLLAKQSSMYVMCGDEPLNWCKIVFDSHKEECLCVEGKEKRQANISETLLFYSLIPLQR